MDPLSCIASGIALYQLLQSIKDLVEIGLAVKDASPKLTALFNSIQLLADAIDKVRDASNVVAFDAKSTKILEACEKKVSSLLSKVKSDKYRLNSINKRQRTWQALKSTLERDEIASRRSEIQDIQFTLQLLLSALNLSSTASLEAGQEKLLAGVDSIEARFDQLVERSMRDPNFIAAFSGSKKANPAVSCLKEQAEGQYTATIEVVLEPCQSKGAPPPDCVSTERQISRKLHSKSRSLITQWNRRISTPGCTVQLASQSYTVTTIRDTESIETTETTTKYVVAPNALSRLFGMTRGVTIESSSTTGWKYSIQAFREVPSNSLIFEFAQKGNKDAVQALFKHGHASPWDRDPQGRTPLWYAAENLQLEVAEFLIGAGADLHAGEWRSSNEPIFATVNSKQTDFRPKLAMINMLQRHSRDDYRDKTLGRMIVRFMFAYRPQKKIGLEWAQRREAVYQLMVTLLPSFHAKHPDLPRILHDSIRLYYEQNVIQRLLCMMEGPIDVSDSSQSVVYEALHTRLLHRDPVTMKIIMQRSTKLHTAMTKTVYLEEAECLTPTLLALYDMDTFLLWRQTLKDLGHDMRAFVVDEFEESGDVLRKNGWGKETLLAVFEVNVERGLERSSPKMNFGFPTCERCGDQGTMLGARLKVDLEWRRRLRDVRSGRFAVSTSSASISADFTDGELSSATTLDDDSDITIVLGSKQTQSKDVAVVLVRETDEEGQTRGLPYRIVCSRACRDGVCVAWMFEGDDLENEKVELPPYPLPPSPQKENMDLGRVMEISEDVGPEHWPTKNMPGAFVE